MLSKEIRERLNTQINEEFFAAYLYLDFANYYKNEGLMGFADWYTVQAKEEIDHAMLITQYLQNNNEAITLNAIGKPDKVFTGFGQPLQAGLEHEVYVTGLIHSIYDLADSEKDYRTMQFLDWFVAEQGEEELNAEDLIKKFALFGSDAKGLYMLDAELAGRVYTAPSLVL